MASCSTCWDLDPQKKNADPQDSGWITSTALRAAASNRRHPCRTCRMLKDAMETLIRRGGLMNADRTTFTNTGDLTYSIYVALQESEDTRATGSRSLGCRLRCKALDGEAHTEDSEEVHGAGFDDEYLVELYTSPVAQQSLWPVIGPSGEVPTNPSAEECARKINEWVHDCQRNHAGCRIGGLSDDPGPLPKRVLDLSGNNIRLVESGGRKDHYVALSHCWGPDPEEILRTGTTRQTLKDRMRGIELQDLPLTFQDAVCTTRALGIRFLWIDSLCIIQKDAVDWEEQSAIMADIYAGCFLNLAATRASSGREGFLSPRWTSQDTLEWLEEDIYEPMSRIRKCEVRSFTIPVSGGPPGQAVRVRLPPFTSHESLQTLRWVGGHEHTAPLMQRGWVYQERVLSPRTVHFHANEMLWDCRTIQRCECHALDGRPPGDDQRTVSKSRIGSLGTLNSKEQLHGLWRTAVEDYLPLLLTKESDRLPALSGIASTFAEYLPKRDQYLAGLWQSDLARDLLWKIDNSAFDKDGMPVRTTGSPLPGLTRPPSWSWASLTFGCEIEWESETKSSLWKQDPRFCILNASCTVKGKNKYGEVSEGSLIVEGAVCAVVLGARVPNNSLRSSPNAPYPDLSSIPVVMDGSIKSLNYHYDLYDRTTGYGQFRGRTIYCLFIGAFVQHTGGSSRENFGLMLQRSSEVPGSFERIGVWEQHIGHGLDRQELFTEQAGTVRLEIV